MRFLIGLLLGFALGFAAAILFAPEKRKHEEHRWQAPPEREEPEAAARENHDFMAPLRGALRSLQGQVQEAWAEAVQAADEAENEMRARYQRMARRTARSRD